MKRFVRIFLLVLPIYLATIGGAYLVEDYLLQEPVQPRPIEQSITDPKPEPIPEILNEEQAVETIAATDLKEWLYEIASDAYEGRGPGQPGYEKSVLFIQDKCKEWGLKVVRQEFDVRGEPTWNLIAWIEGTDPAKKDEIIVVGAHLDHLGKRRNSIYNGADDNGSGSVGVMSIAKAFSKMGPQPRTIVFQWYSAEEMGLVGSRYYCDNPMFPEANPNIRSHIAMINLDMVGRMDSGMYRTRWHTRTSSIDLGHYVQELSRTYPFARRITTHGAGGSDHASFYNKRIPVAFLHTGTHSDYHRTTDDPDKINYEGMEKIVRYAFQLACKVENADQAPKFNFKTFVPMLYVNDHGHPNILRQTVTTSRRSGCASCVRPRIRR